MSGGNQYVYSIEIANANGGSPRLDLVHKNRKLVLRRAEELISNLERTHMLMTEIHHRSLILLTFVYQDRSCICDSWIYGPKPEYDGQLPSISIIVRAWIIKRADPDSPTRGTLKAKMGLEPRCDERMFEIGRRS